MAGYSRTPLIKKLGIKPDSNILFINEPASFYKELGQIPSSVQISKNPDSQFDYIHYFAFNSEELEMLFGEVKKILKKDGMLWISWVSPTRDKSAKLNENIIRDIGLKSGLVDVKVAAIDDKWSGLKFVYRIKDRKYHA